METARAFHRVRQLGEHPEVLVADGERAVRRLWQHCEIWQLDKEVCDLAEAVAPATLLRSLDALHLATFVLARREIGELQLLTTDDRLRSAAGST